MVFCFGLRSWWAAIEIHVPPKPVCNCPLISQGCDSTASHPAATMGGSTADPGWLQAQSHRGEPKRARRNTAPIATSSCCVTNHSPSKRRKASISLHFQQWKWLSVRKGQRGQQTSKNCVFWSRQKAEEQGEGEWALWGAAQVCVTPRLHGRHGLPGSELLRHGSLKQQAWFLFRLLLFHWCFSIYLSDQVIKDLKRKNTNWVPQ